MENSTRPSHPRRTLAALLALLLVVYLVEIRHGLPNRDIVWGYDANPLLPLIAAKKVFLEGWNTGWHTPYPNFHYWVLLLFFGPFMAVQWLLGNLAGLRMEGGYPYGLKDFDILFMHLATITRLVSVAMAVGAAYWVYRIGNALYSHRAGVFAACIAGFSPAIVYYVHIETLDVPMLFWISAALYCYVRTLQTLELRYYVGLAVLAAVSTATKDYAYGAFVLMPIPLVAALARHAYGSIAPRALARAAFDRRHVWAVIAFAIAFALAENWIWNFSGFVNHVKVAGGIDPAGNVITTSFGRLDFFSPLRVANSLAIMTFVLGWAGLAVCGAGVVYALVRDRPVLAVLAWPALGYYVFTVCQVLPAWSEIERPFLPLGMLLAVFGGALLARLSGARATLSRALVPAILALVAANGLAMTVALVTDPRYQAERWLREHAQAGAKIDFYGKRSELPRIDPRWASVVLNIDRPPLSDIQVTGEPAVAAALAQRSPDLIVVSEAFFWAHADDTGTPAQRSVHAFLRRMREGELGYAQAERFPSPATELFRFPPRLTPPVTVFSGRR